MAIFPDFFNLYFPRILLKYELPQKKYAYNTAYFEIRIFTYHVFAIPGAYARGLGRGQHAKLFPKQNGAHLKEICSYMSGQNV